MIKQLYIIILCVSLSSFCFSQDTLLELSTNHHLKVESQLLQKNITPQAKALLTLPFFDDFSQNYIYPNQNLWQNNNIYVNKNFADNPITYGVATFDGLDYTGTPYNFSNPNSWGPADTLTSQPIDLTTTIDSVFLSFFYQPQGLGNKPETKDSLRLEFFRKSDSTWIRVWGTPGVANHPFKRVILPVDTSYHNDEFQFRFINWATLSGNVDHWNLDYIYLNDNRNYQDTVIRDVSFITNHQTMLAEFMAMPWSHYKTDTSNFMAEKMSITYRNNDTTAHNVFYEYQVLDNNGTGPVIETYPTSTSFFLVNSKSNFTNNVLFIYDNTTSQNFFYFPPDTSKSKVFQIKNYFGLNPFVDNYPDNDTINYYQVFGSYYAYDDGSAEVGYGIQGIGAKLAHEFNIKKSDTLTALQIYFNPIQDNLSGESFRLKVWSSLNPEVEIYSQPATQFTSPIYSNTNEFINYPLDQPLYLTAGTYYFGWEKITAPFLNVGWDLNTNNKTKVHFNAVGVWQTSSFDGSLMLRPVFGNEPDPIVSVSEDIENDDNYLIFPNPASNYVQLSVPNHQNHLIELFELSGKKLIEFQTENDLKINLQNFANGIYLVKFTNLSTQSSIFKKIIIAK